MPYANGKTVTRGRSPAVGIDATPLATGHAIRGIGRYVSGLLDAVAEVDPQWAASALGLLLLRGQPAPLDSTVWRTVRSRHRPQDLDPIMAPIADRLAIRAKRPGLWHHTDPSIPWAPLPPGRTLVTTYDVIPLLEPTVMARIRPHRRIAYRRYLELTRRARGIIAISGATADDVERVLGVPRDRIRIVPPCVPARVLPESVTATGGPPVFLIVGVPDPHKRVDLALEAFSILVHRGVDAMLVFAGLHPPAARARLTDLVGQRRLSRRVRFADRIDDAELGRLYARSILLATSRVEGFGLPPVEAIVAGGRVVATPTRAYREVVGGTATFAASDEPEAIADAMEAALETATAASARQTVIERYSARSVSQALRAAYHDFELA